MAEPLLKEKPFIGGIKTIQSLYKEYRILANKKASLAKPSLPKGGGTVVDGGRIRGGGPPKVEEGYMERKHNPELTNNAKALRKNMTKEE